MKLKEFTVKLTDFALALLFIPGIGSTAFGAMNETRTTVTADGEGLWIYPGRSLFE